MGPPKAGARASNRPQPSGFVLCLRSCCLNACRATAWGWTAPAGRMRPPRAAARRPTTGEGVLNKSKILGKGEQPTPQNMSAKVSLISLPPPTAPFYSAKGKQPQDAGNPTTGGVICATSGNKTFPVVGFYTGLQLYSYRSYGDTTETPTLCTTLATVKRGRLQIVLTPLGNVLRAEHKEQVTTPKSHLVPGLKPQSILQIIFCQV